MIRILIAQYWRQIVAAALLAALTWGAYTWAYHRGAAAVAARWAAQRQADALVAARADAAHRAREAAQRQAAIDAETRFQNEQAHNDTLGRRNADLVRRLRDLAARGRDVPGPIAGAPGTQPAGDGFDAGRASDALAGFAARCAREHDGLAAQVNGLLDGWPR